MSDGIPALGGMSWEEAELVRHESGRLLFPEKLRRFNEKGALVETKVRVWVPVPEDHILARTEARVWFAEQKHLDPDRDKDTFTAIEQVCLLARAIRTDAEPHSQFTTSRDLARYDEACLQDIQERINQYKDLLEVRPVVQTDEQFWKLTAEIGRKRNLLPLADIASRGLRPYLVRMAQEALRSPTAPSSASSSESSTPES